MSDNQILNKNEIDFLSQIGHILFEESEPSKIICELKKIYTLYLDTKDLTAMVWDETAGKLRDFSKEWVSFDNDDYNSRLNCIYKDLELSKGSKFLFNLVLSKQKFDENSIEQIKDSISDNENFLYFPLSSSSGTFGVIEITFGGLTKEKIFNTNFIPLINLACMQISSVILNYILREQMETNLHFHEAMKNIAKIIESQYELAYIIPLIGEMIDRFISAHLIYIFIKNKDGDYELLWPNACKDKEITILLNRINPMTEYIISDNQKIGIFPLINENTVLGAIVAYSNIDKLIQKEIEYLLQLSKQSSTTIQRANVYAEVLKHATLDALTGLNNRRQFEMRLNQEIATTRRKNTPLCCMMLDVDYFKKVNDTYGHAAGDCVLKAVSQLISKEIREYDIASRYGGEEFFIILPQTGIAEANFVAQRLRKAVEEAEMDITDAKVAGVDYLKITVSIGVSSFGSEDTAEEFYHHADQALYEAKNRGRNKVVVYNKNCECS